MTEIAKLLAEYRPIAGKSPMGFGGEVRRSAGFVYAVWAQEPGASVSANVVPSGVSALGSVIGICGTTQESEHNQLCERRDRQLTCPVCHDSARHRNQMTVGCAGWEATALPGFAVVGPGLGKWVTATQPLTIF
jgi:hypothetical protein